MTLFPPKVYMPVYTSNLSTDLPVPWYFSLYPASYHKLRNRIQNCQQYRHTQNHHRQFTEQVNLCSDHLISGIFADCRWKLSDICNPDNLNQNQSINQMKVLKFIIQMEVSRTIIIPLLEIVNENPNKSFYFIYLRRKRTS